MFALGRVETVGHATDVGPLLSLETRRQSVQGVLVVINRHGNVGQKKKRIDLFQQEAGRLGRTQALPVLSHPPSKR